MEKLAVRKANKNDIEILKDIYKESFNKELSPEIKYNNENIYVVTLNEKVIGMCMIDYIDDIFISIRTAYINLVCIANEYRNKGIAKYMLKEIEKQVKKDGAKQIMLTSSKDKVWANKLYKNLGFSIYETNVLKKSI